MRGYQLVFLIFFLIVTGFYLENSYRFQKIKSSLQNDTISTEILNFGQMGKILKRLDYIQIKANDNTRFKVTDQHQDDLELITFQKKRMVNEFLYQAAPLHKRKGIRLKSTELKKKEKKGWPILSISINDKALYDQEIGIIANREKKGRFWERKANVSFIENGQIIFSSDVGLRIHGGKRRTIKPYNSFRLYFKQEYGAERLPNNLLFDNKAFPIQTLVVHTTDWPPNHPFNNPLAYDIANQIGSIAPQTRLVELYLNNKSLGMSYVTEHLSRKQWAHHFGHKEFMFFKFRGSRSARDKQRYNEIFFKQIADKSPLTIEKTGAQIDIDNLSRQIFGWAFCGTTDYCQGVGVLDYQDPQSKLAWLTWDMDHSFYDHGATRNYLERKNWEQPAFKMMYFEGWHICGRPVLFSRLMRESEEYRKYFINLISGLLNHKLTKEFLFSRIAYYKTMLDAYGQPHHKYIDMLREFMAKRPGFIRKDIAHYFQLKGPFIVKLVAPKEKEFIIDNYPEKGVYEGYYYYGFPCTIKLEGKSRENFSHWLIDGEKELSDSLNINIKNKTVIEAVFVGKE